MAVISSRISPVINGTSRNKVRWPLQHVDLTDNYRLQIIKKRSFYTGKMYLLHKLGWWSFWYSSFADDIMWPWKVNVENPICLTCQLSHSQNSQNPDCAQDIIVIFDSMVWFWGLANLTVCQLNLPWNDPCCHGNKIRDKIVYNSTYIRNIDEIIALSWAFSR